MRLLNDIARADLEQWMLDFNKPAIERQLEKRLMQCTVVEMPQRWRVLEMAVRMRETVAPILHLDQAQLRAGFFRGDANNVDWTRQAERFVVNDVFGDERAQVFRLQRRNDMVGVLAALCAEHGVARHITAVDNGAHLIVHELSAALTLPWTSQTCLQFEALRNWCTLQRILEVVI